MAKNLHITLPSHQSDFSPQSRSAKRAPLTPSRITPPSLSAQTSAATRRDSSGYADLPKARALLSKVASTPGTPTGASPVQSPYSMPSQERPLLSRSQSEAWTKTPRPRHDVSFYYWNKHRNYDGYISFPDYEKYYNSGDNGFGSNRSRDDTAKA